MREYLELGGTTPYEEICAQVGSDGYSEQARKEGKVFIEQLRRIFGNEPEGCELRLKSFSHEFGTYYEVICYYNPNDEESVEFAFNLESDGPATWDEQAKAELFPELVAREKLTQERISELQERVNLDLISIHEYADHTNEGWEDRHFYYVRLASSGDYDNSCQVKRANYKVFQETFEWMDSISGDYGWEAAGVEENDLADIPQDQWESFLEMVDGLADYPALSDEAVSEAENEAENEAWESWLESDVRRALEEKLNCDFLEIESDKLWELVLQSMDASNTYFQHESGGNVYLDIKRITPKLIELLPEFAS